MLKIDSMFKPFPTVLGSPAETGPRGPMGAFPYGFRKLSPDLAFQLLGGGERQPSGEGAAGLLSMLRSDTVVPEEGRSYAQGPFILTGPRRPGLSESQRALDDKLTLEMRRFLRIKYPAYG